MARKSNIEIVMDVERQREAIRAANLRHMHEQASRLATQVAGTLTAGARRNAFGGILRLGRRGLVPHHSDGSVFHRERDAAERE